MRLSLSSYSVFEFRFQTDYQHAARGVKSVFARRGVDTAVYAVEDIVNADARLDGMEELKNGRMEVSEPEAVGGVQVPDAEAWGIFVGA